MVILGGRSNISMKKIEKYEKRKEPINKKDFLHNKPEYENLIIYYKVILNNHSSNIPEDSKYCLEYKEGFITKGIERTYGIMTFKKIDLAHDFIKLFFKDYTGIEIKRVIAIGFVKEISHIVRFNNLDEYYKDWRHDDRYEILSPKGTVCCEAVYVLNSVKKYDYNDKLNKLEKLIRSKEYNNPRHIFNENSNWTELQFEEKCYHLGFIEFLRNTYDKNKYIYTFEDIDYIKFYQAYLKGASDGKIYYDHIKTTFDESILTDYKNYYERYHEIIAYYEGFKESSYKQPKDNQYKNIKSNYKIDYIWAKECYEAWNKGYIDGIYPYSIY